MVEEDLHDRVLVAGEIRMVIRIAEPVASLENSCSK